MMESQTAGETSRSGSGNQTLSQIVDDGGASHLPATIRTSLSNIAHNQASGEGLTINSGDEEYPDLGPEIPLANHEDANRSQLGAAAEQDILWFFGSNFETGVYPAVVMTHWLLIIYCIILVILINGIYRFATDRFIDALIIFPVGLGSLALGFLITLYLSKIYPVEEVVTFRGAVIICAMGFGFHICLNWVLLITGWNVVDISILRPWLLDPWPHSFDGCDVRVQPKQSLLFSPNIYYTQFARKVYDNSLQPPYFFNMSLYHSIQMDQTLCEQGFIGNSDLYGLGIRIGIYLQWISSLLANNLLPENRQELQKIYLIFSLAICIATFVLSFTDACIFSIEIELLYWMYWGGFVCVFVSSPSPIRLRNEIKWIGLDWITAVLCMTHILMVCHGIWVFWYAYDQVFSRMPCGTYHFCLVPMLDPSEGFWDLRHLLMTTLAPIVPVSLLSFLFIGILLIPEIKQSIQHSAIYQAVFPLSNHSDSDQLQNVRSSLSVRVYLGIKRLYYIIRVTYFLPAHTRRGIRLVTPIDIRKQRKYRIFCAIFGLASYALSIAAIELTLKWNRVVGVNSLASVGQYMSFIIGASSFISICWQLVQQEAKRRRDSRRRQAISWATNGIELEYISTTLSDAISHAFGQPDVEFLRNGGALPTTSDEGLSFSP